MDILAGTGYICCYWAFPLLMKLSSRFHLWRQKQIEYFFPDWAATECRLFIKTFINGNYPLLWHCTKMGVPLSPAMMKHLIDQLHIRYGGALPIDIGNAYVLMSIKMVRLVFRE